MRLSATDTRLVNLARTVEAAAERFDVLDDVEIAIQVVANFAELGTAAIQQTPARFDDDSCRVLINAATFFDYPFESWLGIVAHELGEFVALHHPQLVEDAAPLVRDLKADYFACLLGFADSVAAGRSDRDATYHEALRSWNTPDKFVESMNRWRNMKIVGTRN